MSGSKAVKILYIEDNVDDQLILKRVIKRNIKQDIIVDVADTAEKGYNKIKTNNYQIIFLDYRLPDKTGLDLLTEIRQEGNTTPVFFLTGEGNEKIAVEAMKRGVEDYIIKNEVQSKEFVSSIQNILSKTKDSEESETDLTELEKRLLKEYKQSSVEFIEPKFHENKFVYTGIEQFVKENGLEKTTHILSQLETKSRLEKQSETFQIVCPKCDSPANLVESSYVCNECMSKDIKHIIIMSHPHCGYTGGRSHFITDKGLVCPNCGVVLTSKMSSGPDGEKNGYQIIGSVFECQSCSKRFNRPIMMHCCSNCGEQFSYKDMKYIKTIKYKSP